jgi:hypothetical protein
VAVDETHADQMRADLGDRPGLSEKRMFGGLCFFLHDHMVCGVSARAAMYRVGKPAEAQALALPGVEPMAFTGRKMGGIVDLPLDSFGDDDTRHALTARALAHAGRLPPKAPKTAPKYRPTEKARQ